MLIQRLLPRGRGARIVATTTALALSLGGASAALDMRAAGALGTTHKLNPITKQNFSEAVERPGATFTCNDATGAYKFKATNVQVIQADHVTPWTSYGVRVLVANFTNPQTIFRINNIPLTQNSTNGLYTATASGTLPPSLCVSQNEVSLLDDIDNDGFNPLFIDWTLT